MAVHLELNTEDPTKIGQLILALEASCKASVEITINGHRDSYQTTEELFGAPDFEDSVWDETPEGVQTDILVSNRLVEIQAYPDTPIGSFRVYGAELTEPLKRILADVVGR